MLFVNKHEDFPQEREKGLDFAKGAHGAEACSDDTVLRLLARTGGTGTALLLVMAYPVGSW